MAPDLAQYSPPWALALPDWIVQGMGLLFVQLKAVKSPVSKPSPIMPMASIRLWFTFWIPALIAMPMGITVPLGMSVPRETMKLSGITTPTESGGRVNWLILRETEGWFATMFTVPPGASIWPLLVTSMVMVMFSPGSRKPLLLGSTIIIEEIARLGEFTVMLRVVTHWSFPSLTVISKATTV